MFEEQTHDHRFIDIDFRGNPLMTIKTITYYCQKEGISMDPPPKKLYLNNKGFTKIENLDNISHGLQSLWLDHNTIKNISGLDYTHELICLYLNNNIIEKIQNLNNLNNLAVLNLSHNKIQKIQNLGFLPNLSTLNVSSNFISNTLSIQKLIECHNLSSLDLSHNQLICSEDIFNIIKSLTTLTCLYLKSTPFNRGFKNYRKRIIASLIKLKFLDDRSVQEEDHRLSQAWAKGGIELEKQQKFKLIQQKQAQNKKKIQQYQLKQQKQLQEKQKQLEQQRKPYQQKLQILQSKYNKTQQQQKQMQKLQKKIKQINNKIPKSFLANIKDNKIKISNVKNQQQQQQIINQYFINQKKQLQAKIIKEKQQIQLVKSIDQEKQQQTLKQIKNLLSKDDTETIDNIKNKWNRKYQPLLESLLEKYRFDFSEVQPSFNMILSQICKKTMKPYQRFQIPELRYVWTQVQIRKRNQTN